MNKALTNSETNYTLDGVNSIITQLTTMAANLQARKFAPHGDEREHIVGTVDRWCFSLSHMETGNEIQGDVNVETSV